MIAIDFGDECIKLACWKKSTNPALQDVAEIIQNDMSKKRTPSYIAFKNQQVVICDHAKSGMFNNSDNYIWNFKRVIGTHSLIENIEDELKRERLKSNINVEEDLVSYNVIFNKEHTSVAPEHVLSIIFEYCYYLASKTIENGYDDMKEVARQCNDTNSIIMTIPSYFNNAHLSGIQLALDMKNFKEIRFIRDYVATALDYGYYRNLDEEFQDKSRVVFFVDMGAVCTTLTLVRYSHNKIEILATDYLMVGGQDIDEILYRKLIEIYERDQEISLDEYSENDRKRQLFLLKEKAKAIKEDFSSSGIDDVICEIEVIPEDDEIEIEVERDEFFEGCSKVFEKVETFMNDFLKKAQWTEGKIDVCEFSSGASRMLPLRDMTEKAIAEYGCSRISATLLMDECIVKGACLCGHLVEQKTIAVPMHTTHFEYTDYMNVKRKHDLQVIGCGEEVSAEDKLVLLNPVDVFQDQDPKPHNFEKLSKFIYQRMKEFGGIEEASGLWMATRGRAINEVHDALDSLPENYKNREEIKKKLEAYRMEFERLPGQGTAELIAQVEQKTKEVHSILVMYKEIWENIGRVHPYYIHYNPNNPRNGKLTIYREDNLDTECGFCTFKNDILDGELHERDENGKLVVEMLFFNNKLFRKLLWKENMLKEVRIYDQNKSSSVKKCISFYDKYRIEHIRDFSKKSHLRVYYAESGMVKRVVFKNNTVSTMFEYRKDGSLLYEGPFIQKKERVVEDGKSAVTTKKVYIRDGEGSLYTSTHAYLKGVFSDNGAFVKIDNEMFSVDDLFNKPALRVKVYTEDKKEKATVPHPWKAIKENKSKKSTLYFYTCNKSQHVAKKLVEDNKTNFQYTYGLVGCCLTEENKDTKEKRALYPIFPCHACNKMLTYYPYFMYWDRCKSNITKEIIKYFYLEGLDLVVNMDICERNKFV